MAERGRAKTELVLSEDERDYTRTVGAPVPRARSGWPSDPGSCWPAPLGHRTLKVAESQSVSPATVGQVAQPLRRKRRLAGLNDEHRPGAPTHHQ